ncbi:MAG TPA: transcription termination/antitermination NusG family protein [Methylomirabilota bacterium]|nr:transcription termination/antitermination NusG family protein [Methylomirabilota bacterium]
MPDVVTESLEAYATADRPAGDAVMDARWFVLWTKSHCEQLVHDQLVTKGFRTFLPTIEVWSRRADLRRRIRVPMFPGYLFLHDALDKYRDVEVRKARGLVTILGEGWDRRAVLPARDVEAIRRVVDARAPARPHPYLKVGHRVRIVRGPMTDVEGILLRVNDNKGLLVISVELLNRSVAVEVDCTLTVPA